MFAFEIVQHDMVVASGSGNDDRLVYAEACHYFSQYRQYGPCQVTFGPADEDGRLKHGSQIPADDPLNMLGPVEG